MTGGAKASWMTKDTTLSQRCEKLCSRLTWITTVHRETRPRWYEEESKWYS